MTEFRTPSRKRELLLMALVFTAVVLPRIFQLDQFVTSDEHLWLTASGNFYYALAQRDLAETYRFEAPAVTTIWAGVAGYLVTVPEYRGWGQGYMARENLEGLFESHGMNAIDVLAAGRAFIVLGSAVGLALAFLYARKLFGTAPALAGLFLIAFDPFHIAMTRVLHMDGLLSVFMMLSVLAYLAYLYRGFHRLDLVVSGIAAGLSVLSKSPGIFLVPFIGLISLTALIRKQAEIKRLFSGFAAWLGIGFASFLALWPAMWVEPGQVLNNVFVWAFRFASGGHDSGVYFNGEVFLDTEIGLDLLNFYPVTFLWRTTPYVLAGLGLLVYLAVKKSGQLENKETRALLLDLSFFVLFFTLFMTLGGKKFDRYLLPVYPLLDLMAGLAWIYFMPWLKGYFSFLKGAGREWVFLGLLGVAHVTSVLSHFPYYFSYYNSFLGGTAQAPEVMMIGWGEGLEQAGAYLGEKPGAEDLTVFSWYGEGPFSYFFPGETISILIQPDWQRGNARHIPESDYIVTYIHQGQRQMTPPLLEVLSRMEPEHTVWIRDLPYVEIYKVSDIPEADMEILLAPVNH